MAEESSCSCCCAWLQCEGWMIADGGNGIVCFCTLNLSSGVRLNFISRFSICLNFFCSFLTSPIWKSRGSWKKAPKSKAKLHETFNSQTGFNLRLSICSIAFQQAIWTAFGRYLNGSGGYTGLCSVDRRVTGCWQYAWGVLLSLQRHHVDTEAIANWRLDILIPPPQSKLC